MGGIVLPQKLRTHASGAALWRRETMLIPNRWLCVSALAAMAVPGAAACAGVVTFSSDADFI